MKIILSRKGFDSATGGYPSPIMPDGVLLSMPIPDLSGEIKYAELKHGKLSYLEILRDLIGKSLILNKERHDLNENLSCHLDPDLIEKSYQRRIGWRGAFGQRGAAETHLRNNEVTSGDIFLFFGWFRETEYKKRLIYSSNDKLGRHIIYGYLQVGDIIDLAKEEGYPKWLDYHPHIKGSSESNRIYLARDYLSFADKVSGYGSFLYNKHLVLTMPGYSRSKWNLPEIFKDVNITYHNSNSWKENYFQCAYRGQEFVIEENSKINDYVKKLIINSERV